MPLLPVIAILLLGAAGGDGPQINPAGRPEVSETLVEWTFDAGSEGWAAQHDATLWSEAGLLVIEATGDDPYVHRPLRLPGGPMVVEMKVRRTNSGGGAVYWTTDRSPQRGEGKVQHFAIKPTDAWQEVAASFDADGTLTDLRIDPGTTPGRFEIDWIRFVRRRLHPLSFERVDVDGSRVLFTLKNHQAEQVEFIASGENNTIGPAATLIIERPLLGQKPIEPVSLELGVDGFPPMERNVFVHNAAVTTQWVETPLGTLTLQVARDGSIASLKRGQQLVGLLAPLVHRGGAIPVLELVEEQPAIRFRGEGISVRLAARGDELDVRIESDEPVEGPVVRALGSLEQGLLAGLEYLGKGERSSSMLDVETAEHLRFRPDPLKMTMPLAVLVTDRVSLALLWRDTRLQPTYAVPNFFDAAADHRMSLEGKRIEATLRAGEGPLEESIAWAVRKHGLPPLPPPPRTPQEQVELCLRGLNGPLRDANGWGHCVEPRWQRQPFADMASTEWRLTGKAPAFPEFVPGGAHVRNDAIFFVTARAKKWKEIRGGEVRGILARQQPDGAFRYDGPYRRGHFEDTASGVSARPAAMLLEYAWMTGDEAAIAAGVRTLEYMKRFRTPRGAQVWEVPLHTPDLLASAYLVWAYVRGYELTGKPEYLAEARRWAMSGVPFVYLWSEYPVMLYATPPVYGATNWKAPCWIGLPVQWVGLVYAYALAMLAPYEDTLDWHQLAEGILVAAEQMQYPDGQYAGLLPDAFAIADQQRRPWTINPCALVSLRLVLDGKLDSLAVAVGQRHRVVAPYPVAIRDGRAHVTAQRGVEYQVLLDGERIVDVVSQGEDVLPLE